MCLFHFIPLFKVSLKNFNNFSYRKYYRKIYNKTIRFLRYNPNNVDIRIEPYRIRITTFVSLDVALVLCDNLLPLIVKITHKPFERNSSNSKIFEYSLETLIVDAIKDFEKVDKHFQSTFNFI